MDCNVVKDLIPLCVDSCCSEESEKIVKEHINRCPECKALYENMKTPSEIISTVSAPVKMERVNDWKASVLQSVLLFISFALITIGVALEASTPSGLNNGYWAISLVIPATGFMLSLANWYFVRLYKNRKCFSNCSLLITLGITVCAYIWAGFHYEFDVIGFAEIFGNISFQESLEVLAVIALVFGVGILFTAIFCVLSKVLSDKFAKMLGKE